jgi:transcriptional regulator with XRE-family HTH domain
MNGEPVPFGDRLRRYRERAGMSRPVFGGLVGRSAEWVKAVETGRLAMPRLSMLLHIAEVLGVNDLTDLTGDQSKRIDRFSRGEHPSVPAVRAAVNRYTLTKSADQPYPVDVLRGRVDAAWWAWRQSRDRRADVGSLLPALITDVRVAAAALDGVERRAAHAVLADTYHLTQHLIVNAADPALLWLVVDRAMAAAQTADRPLALAGGAWTVGMMLRAAGRMDESLILVREAADLLEPRLADGGDEWRAMWGPLQLHGAITAARAGRDGDAWAWWDRADRVARTLPAGYMHPWTAFGAANTGLHAVSLTVDLWKSREALRRAEAIDPAAIPSRERRGRFYVEMARGHFAAKDRIAAARLLLLACDEGVDAVRWSPAARVIVDDLTAHPPTAVRDDVRQLVVRLDLADH